MWNHLAEEVLNDGMYNLMTKYQGSVKDGTHLEAALDLLDHTKEIVKVFRDPRPIVDMKDSRLDKLSNFDKWLMEWSGGVELLECSKTEKSKMLLSDETFCDIISMLREFREICKIRIEKHEKCVVPAGINSDIVENFCASSVHFVTALRLIQMFYSTSTVLMHQFLDKVLFPKQKSNVPRSKNKYSQFRS